MMRRFFGTVVGALTLVFGLGANSTSHAESIFCSNVTYELSTSTDEACSPGTGNEGNDTLVIDSSFSLFGQTGWSLADKSNSTDGDETITFTDAPTHREAKGTWAITDPTGIASDVVITLKQSNSFAAFLIQGTSGTWSTKGSFGNPNAGGNPLSHASIYYQWGNGTSIPVPATFALLGAGLIGLGLLSRRRVAT